MTTLSDGFNDFKSMDTRDDDFANVNQNIPTAGNLRIQLQALLDDKEKQLKLAGTLGQRVLAQQVELEERIQHLNDLEAAKAAKTNPADEDAVESNIREKLSELRDIMNSWESENQDIFDIIGNNKVNDMPPSPVATSIPTLGVEDTSTVASPTSGPSAAQSSRRAKNAAHRAHDVEFAFEIGSSLLTEVRRLQSLIAERDKGIQDLKEENQDLVQVVEGLKAGLEGHKSTAEKYKEENWNLEVTLQELRTQLQNAQKEQESAELDRKRTAKELAKARDNIDQHKNEAERLTTTLAEFKAKHETDVAQMRKQAAGLQRDKSDLQSTLEALKVDIAKKDRSIKRFGSPLTPNGLSPYTPAVGAEGEEEDDVFGTTGGASNRRKLDSGAPFGADLGDDFADSSPDPSPSRPHLSPNHPSNEIEVLKQSLAHAQRQMNMLRGTVQREKELNLSYRRKLVEAEGRMGAVLQEDDEEEEENVDPNKSRPPRPPRTRGRGMVRRGRGARSNLAQRMIIAPGSPDSEIIDEFDETETGGPQQLPEFNPDEEEESRVVEEHHLVENKEMLKTGRPVSVDGMDPAFANVLRDPSVSPGLHGSSPLREVITAPLRGNRRGRGGIPRAIDSRPPSVVEPSTALAAELGMTENFGPELVLSQHVETAEFACQTDPEPLPEPRIEYVPAPVQVPVQTHDIAIQAQEEIPRIAYSDANVQIESLHSYNDAAIDAPIALTSEMDVQTLPVPIAVEMQTDAGVLAGTIPITISNVSAGVTRRGTIVGGSSAGGRLRTIEGDDEGEATETDTGTETEGEYTDAHEFPTPTPMTGSVSDFYSTHSGPRSNADIQSVRTGAQDSTVDFYSVRSVPMESDADDSDQESIKASKYGRTRTSSRITTSNIGIGYANRDVSTPAVPPPPLPVKVMSDESVQVEDIKPEVKEFSIQTDEWVPPAPYGLPKVGSTPHQFQYIAPPASPTSPSPSGSQANTSRDTSTTLTIVPRRTSSLVSREHDRRPSIEAAFSPEETSRPRQNTQSLLPPPDKTRPPTMMLPPPPRMPPPTTLPEKKASTASSRDMRPPRDIPPPRPTSPPPVELIQRATTPTFQNLGPPTRGQLRQHGSSMPPATLGHRPSTNSFRSAANAAAHASGISNLDATRRHQSAASLSSSRQSSISQRSSISSDHHNIRPVQPVQKTPATPGRSQEPTTDPAVIHAITQTMIGEFLYKYTRKVVGKGHGERRHKRFFWVHPYTKTVYWSSADPGSTNVSESSAKSAYIESVRSILDPNPMPPGLHQYSIIVATPQREMKITAPTKERHDIWFNALNYLLTRPPTAPTSPPQAGQTNGASHQVYGSMRLPRDEHARNNILASPRSGRSIGSVLSGDSWNITPRAQRSASRLSVRSAGKRSGTPAAEYLRLGGRDGPASPSKSDYEYVPGQMEDDEDLDFEIHDHVGHGADFEGLENVRACCDGRHDLGTLSRRPHHHHHHHHHVPPNSQNQNLETEEPVSRPVSPSAWSSRSRAASTNSRGQQDTASIWSRFGSKRSKNAPRVPASPSGRH